MNTAVARTLGVAPDYLHTLELRRVRAVTFALERLLDSPARRDGRERHAIADAVARGVDLLEMLARDASRRLDGRPAALLDEAVQSLVDEVDRITWSPPITGGVGSRRSVCIRGPWSSSVAIQ